MAPPRNPFYGWIGLDYIDGKLDAINHKLDLLLTGQAKGKELIMAEQEEIANLVEQVRANRDVVASATTALDGLVQKVAQLSEELQDAIDSADSDVSSDIKAVADDLKANTEALQAAIPQLAQAVKANTDET